MKKIKLISTLSALSVVTAITPVVATSCLADGVDSKVTKIKIDTEATSEFAPVSWDNYASTPVGKITLNLFNKDGNRVNKDVNFILNMEGMPSWMNEAYIDGQGNVYVGRSGSVPSDIELWTTQWMAEVDGVKTEENDISFMYVPNFEENGFIVWQDDAPHYKKYRLTADATGQVTQTQINAFASTTGNITVDTVEGKGTVIKKQNLVTLGIQNTATNATFPKNFCKDCLNLCYVDLKGFETHVTTIPGYFFYNCQSLQEIYLNFPAVTTIGEFFLGNCLSLTSVDFSKMTAVRTIGNACLYKSDNIQTIDVSGFSNIQKIEGVFAQYISNLTRVNFGSITLDKLKTALHTYSFTCGNSNDKAFVEGILLDGTYARDFLSYLPKIENYSAKLFRRCYIK